MKRFTIIAVLALFVIPVKSFAQLDERAPGIYTVVGEESIPLPYIYGMESGSSVGIGIVSIGSAKFTYKGATSGVNASDTFVLVIDPEKKTGSASPKKFDMFLKTMTPEDMMFLPLTTNEKKQRREYDTGTGVGIGIGPVGIGTNTENKERNGFEWEMISDNSFKIKVSDLAPGEYGIIFRQTKIGQFMYNNLFGFTVPEAVENEQQK